MASPRAAQGPDGAASLLGEAVAHHRAGRAGEAKALYRQVLVGDPGNADCHHLLGVLAYQAGDSAVAVEAIERAIALNPRAAAFHANLANALRRLGRLDDAVGHYDTALALDPGYAEAHNNLANALRDLGRNGDAAGHYRRAIELKPDYAEAHSNLANALRDLGRSDEAVDHGERALRLRPDSVEARNNLAAALRDEGRFDDAAAQLRSALRTAPGHLTAQRNLGRVMLEQGRFGEAVDAFRKVVDLAPDRAEAHCDLGTALRVLECGRPEDAIAAYRRALAIEPGNSAALTGLGRVLGDFTATSYQPEMEALLVDLYQSEGIDHRAIAAPAAGQIKHKYPRDWGSRVDAGGRLGDVDGLLADELLIHLLEKGINTDPELELFLTAVRRKLLSAIQDADEVSQNHLRFMAALARHSFSNGYAFWIGSDEESRIGQLEGDVAAAIEALAAPDAAFEEKLLTLAMYVPPHGLACKEKLLAFELSAWSPRLRAVLEAVLWNPAEEARIAKGIRAIGAIDDDTSRAVREQYEENPYPRWLSLPRRAPMALAPWLRREFPQAPRPPFDRGPVDILVAGCGTGQHPINFAMSFANTRVLAVDLSRGSLAYASRMARALGVDNIEFLHGDLLDLKRLGRRFPMIHCVGVLMCLDDPLAGWSILANMLEPGGWMKIGLYSETARRVVVAARQRIAQRGLTGNARDMREFRHDILLGRERDDFSSLTGTEDFYDLNGCRDLLFHVKEHRFTVPQLASAMARLSLPFVGFELGSEKAKQAYRAGFPEDMAMTDLACWARFEKMHPDVFGGMYQFWCRKPAPGEG